MSWRKLGRLFERAEGVPGAGSGAMVPIAAPGRERSIRLLFGSRDADGRAEIRWAELDGLERPAEIDFGRDPLLGLGSLGAFDDNGVVASSLVAHDGCQYLFYIGWNLGVTVPFYSFIGCAISEDDGESFTRVSRAPMVGRSAADPYMAHTPWVVIEDGRWRMWYASATTWGDDRGSPRHRYRITYAESTDGIDWVRDGHVCIDYRDASEYAIARPCVVKDGDRYRMWFSCRGDTYRIGYAESADGYDWTRLDERAGIDVSESGWDSEMIEYPFVFDFGGAKHLLYNGNGYGRSGVGAAIEEAVVTKLAASICIAATIAFTVYGQLIVKWRVGEVGLVPGVRVLGPR